jgi:hypothetical protein
MNLGARYEEQRASSERIHIEFPLAPCSYSIASFNNVSKLSTAEKLTFFFAKR